jgi:hypothetical protein
MQKKNHQIDIKIKHNSNNNNTYPIKKRNNNNIFKRPVSNGGFV